MTEFKSINELELTHLMSKAGNAEIRTINFDMNKPQNRQQRRIAAKHKSKAKAKA